MGNLPFRIEHYMKQGKQGIIDVKVGNPESVHKDKTGHLLVVSNGFTNELRFYD